MDGGKSRLLPGPLAIVSILPRPAKSQRFRSPQAWKRQGGVNLHAGMPGKSRMCRTSIDLRTYEGGEVFAQSLPLCQWGKRREMGNTQGEELARMLEKVRKQGHGFSREELEILGLRYPPRKGWRKKILAEIKGTSKKRRPENPGKEWPANKNGYLVRRTGTGRHHHFINGRALCRLVKNPKRYTFTEVQPTNLLCSVCDGLIEADPGNARVSHKGGRPFYQSWEWKKARYETLLRYGATCMCCGSDHRIVVDHIKPYKKYPDLGLDPDNLQVLCDECNRGKSYDDETDFRPKGDELTAAEYEDLELVSEARDKLH